MQLAHELIAGLSADPLTDFAIRTLDWGTGLAIVPADWREAVGAASFPVNTALVVDAMSPSITADASNDPKRLLYRHAFQLFNQLEHFAARRHAGAVDLLDFRSLREPAQQLRDWQYAPPGEGRCFAKALAAWYPKEVSTLVDDIAALAPSRP